MKLRKRVEWTRLDNASKIFPATCNEKDTKVFRIACELHEDVDPIVLQQALNTTLESFPFYKSVLRRGVFWYYLEASDIQPLVEEESLPVCAPIYIRDRKNLLFRVFYYKNRINLEIFHALSDGTGALWYLQTLVYHYLILKHKDSITDNPPILNASISEKMDDSFGKHFGGEKMGKGIKQLNDSSKAYHIHGTRIDENRMNLIEGSISVKSVLEQAHEHKTTLTIYITSLFIYSIFKGMSTRGKKHPVVLSVPINLRHFFESVSARNFFSTMLIDYHFNKDNSDFDKVIQSVSNSFQKELTQEQLNERLDQFMSLEKNFFARLIPLPLKDNSIRIVNKLKDRGITAAISNIGRIIMPKELDPYIRQFTLCTSARRPQICMCSYGDRLVISFTSPYHETEIQKTFFQLLSKKGIEIEISSNL